MSEIIDLSNIKNTENNVEIKFNPNLSDFSLINFYDKESKNELLASEGTKNILVTGATGTGKTTSVLLPIITNLIKNNCPGLILDIKSDLFSHIYTIAEQEDKLDNILYIGTYDFCKNINILASIKSVNQLKNVLNSIKTATDSNNSYWWESGVDDVTDIVLIHEWLTIECQKQEYHYSFNTMFDYINKVGYAKSIIEKAEEYIISAPEEICSLINKIKTEPFSLYNVTEDSDDVRQKMWRSGQVSNVIAPFIKKPFSCQFSDIKESSTIHDYIYKQGKIIVLVMPIEHESVGHSLGKLIREIFFKSVLSNNATDRYNYIIGKEHNRYTFLLIDEYQFFVNSQGNNGVVTDESWVSISRGYGNINIFATQSITSLISKTKSEIDIDTIHQNCVNEIYLPTKDRRTLDYISYFNDDSSLDINVIKNPKPNTRLGLCRISDNGGVKNMIYDSAMAKEYGSFHSKDYSELKIKNEIKLLSKVKETNLFEIKDTHIVYTDHYYVKLSNSKKLNLDEYYNIDYIADSIERIRKEFNDTKLSILYKEFLRTANNIEINDSTKNKLNFIIDNLKNYKKIINNNIHHEKYKEFLIHNDVHKYRYFVNSDLTEERVRFQILTYPKSKAKMDILSVNQYLDESNFTSINDIFSIIKKESKKDTLTEKERDIINDIKRSQYICISRGGGNFLSNEFDHFRTNRLIQFVYINNPNAIIFTALSHAHDSFMVDLYSDESFVTPTAFGTWAKYIANVCEQPKPIKE